MPDLSIDLALLENTETGLQKIARDITNMPGLSNTLAIATGDGDLAGAVQDFAKNWDRKRHDMESALTTMAKSVSSIHDRFQNLDNQLGQAVAGAVAGSAATPSGSSSSAPSNTPHGATVN
ncbi:MAG: hypothetical protein ABIS08_03995 [Pseudolysinimonas sp.]